MPGERAPTRLFAMVPRFSKIIKHMRGSRSVLPPRCSCVHVGTGGPAATVAFWQRSRWDATRGFLVFLAVAVVTLATLHAQQTQSFTADRHIKRGLTCTQCHGEGAKKPVVKTQCLACHSSYAEVAERTEGLDPNPHDSHQGEVECNQCHKGHKPDELSCTACHSDKRKK